MKLRRKIMILSVFPVLFLGVVLFILASYKIKQGIYNEAYDGMHATTLAVRDIFETGNDGEYHLDTNAQLWKGDSLNISAAYEIVDQIKANTAMEVTVFYHDTRYLTTIKDENGERLIGTKADDEVVEAVLKNGKDFKSDNIKISDTKYIAYYIPLFQEDTDNPIGMVFLGTKQSAVEDTIKEMQRDLFLVGIILLVLVATAVSLILNSVMKALTASVGAINEISNGNLNVCLDHKYRTRKDEIGDISRSVELLHDKLSNIIGGIKKNSEALAASSCKLDMTAKEAASTISQVDFVIQEIASCSTHQATSTEQAAQEVSIMGGMISETMAVINQLNGTTSQMKSASDTAKATLLQLTNSMENVMEVIHSISEQTIKTNESVIKINAAANLINDIANQTNLLALNASIEAARAGEQGKGFAVVATEIKNLSTQSNHSAAEIQELLSQLTDNSNQAVVLMDEIKETLAKQKVNLNKTDEAFYTVTTGIEHSVDGIRAISQKTDTLDVARGQTIKVVDSLTAIAEENAAGSEEAAASVEEVNTLVREVAEHADGLNKIAEELKLSVDIFRI